MPSNRFADVMSLCHKILESPKDFLNLEQLTNIVILSEKSFVNRIKKYLLACVFPFLKMVSENKNSLNEREKLILLSCLTEIFQKIDIDKSAVFFNFYSFLLFELYDHSQHKVLDVSEELKLQVLKCLASLIKSISSDLIEEIYNKKNVPKLSQIMYVCGELIKKEKSKEIRHTTIICLVAFAKVSDSDDEIDIVLQSHISEVFIFFLPGIVSSLNQVIVETTWTGYKLVSAAVTALGRIVALTAQDYDKREKPPIIDHAVVTSVKKALKNKEAVDAYIRDTTKSNEWYKNTDNNLSVLFQKLFKVTWYENTHVKLQLIQMVLLLSRKCDDTLPLTISTLMEVIIALSEDADPEVIETSQLAIKEMSDKLACDSFKNIFENLEEKFFAAIESLPRKFNNVDENAKIASINLLCGYVKLLGNMRLGQALMSNIILDTLVKTLLQISKIDTSKVTLMEEYELKDINPDKSLKTSWINFKHFRDKTLKSKLETFCALLSKNGCFELMSHKLVDSFFYDNQHKKEALYLLNGHILGLEENFTNDLPMLKSIIKIYTDEAYNDLPTFNYDPEEFTHEEIQNNLIQICLLTEGLGNISFSLKMEFRNYLLQCLYLVLRSTGSGHPLIKTSGLIALSNITLYCGYNDVTDLVNSNFDYFSFHVGRKLKTVGDKEGVLNILSVVLEHCKIDILDPICQLIQDVLLESHDRFKQKYATIYLKVFKAFILAVRRWFNITVKIEPFKSKKQQELEYKEFKITGADEKIIDDFSDDIMEGKTAEELYKEDMERKAMELEKDEDQYSVEEDIYKKPEPPLHIKITVDILKTSLNFLPSKEKSRKILVLEILLNGVDIIKDFKDELLPIVHQIWSPLTQRFRDGEDALIVNRSFELLAILARLSKEFIRMRTVKEVLPNILQHLKKLSTESHLKDRGAAYRYTQSYKLQINILENLGIVIANLDVLEATIFECMNCVYLYLSDKQPVALQGAALHFFKLINQYDNELFVQKINDWKNLEHCDNSKNFDKLLKFGQTNS